jgi:hypothetical protein
MYAKRIFLRGVPADGGHDLSRQRAGHRVPRHASKTTAFIGTLTVLERHVKLSSGNTILAAHRLRRSFDELECK